MLLISNAEHPTSKLLAFWLGRLDNDCGIASVCGVLLTLDPGYGTNNGGARRMLLPR